MRGLKFLVTLGLTVLSSVWLPAQINTDRVMSIGRNALYFNDYVLAIQYFNQVIQVKPHLAEPYFFRAVAKLSLEDYHGAEADCGEALERNPFMVRAYYARSYARLNLKDYEGSAADCTKGLEFDTENKSLMLNRAVSYLYAERYDEARTCLDELIGRYPSYLFAYMSRGQLCVETGDTLGAVDDFSRAVSVDKYYAPAYAARGYVALLGEHYTDAIPDFNEAIRLEPDNEGYYLNRGIARYYSNDYRGVLSDFDRVLQLNPQSVATYYNRGLIRAEVGDDNRALEDFDEVLRLEPDNDLAIFNRALLREKTGDMKGAEADLTRIIDLYPNFIPAYYRRSDVRRRQGNAKGADKDYFDAWDLETKLKEAKAQGKRFTARGDEDSPDMAEAEENGKTRELSENDIRKYNRVVVSKEEAEQTARYANPIRGNVQNLNVEVEINDLFSLTFYEQGRPVGQRRAMDYSAYLDSLEEAGLDVKGLRITDMEKALDAAQAERHFQSIDRYSKEIAADSSRAELYFARALDFAMVKDMDSALRDLDKALECKPGFALALFLRSGLRYRRIQFLQSEEKTTEKKDEIRGGLLYENLYAGDYMQVTQDLDRLTRLYPDFVYAWYNRGNIRCRQKDYRSALEDYDRAIALNEDFGEAWYNRGITRLYLGERQEALKDLSRAGELGVYKAYNIIKRFSQ